MKSKHDNNNLVIRDVPFFHLNWDAGDMFMLAIEACLKFLGEKFSSWWLTGVSGDAFKFIYDKGDVREPMRDRVPIDTVSLAYSSMGWEGKWYINEKIESVKSRIRQSLEQGHPVLTSNLGNQWYHGANIITGIDEDKNEFYLQIGRENSFKSTKYEKVPIPIEWNGPIPGSIIWADNPIFILEKKKLEKPEEKIFIIESLNRAINLYKKKSLPYKNHPGAQKYSRPSLKGRSASHGLSAFKELKEEVENSEVTWPLIWSITTQCGQLSYDRFNAANFLGSIAEKCSQFSSLSETARLYKETADIANILKQSYWDNRWSGLNNLDTLQEQMNISYSFVYNISGFKNDIISRIRRILPVMDTLWGPAVILDNSKRRNYNSDLVEGIMKNEKDCIDFLKRNYSLE